MLGGPNMRLFRNIYDCIFIAGKLCKSMVEAKFKASIRAGVHPGLLRLATPHLPLESVAFGLAGLGSAWPTGNTLADQTTLRIAHRLRKQ